MLKVSLLVGCCKRQRPPQPLLVLVRNDRRCHQMLIQTGSWGLDVFQLWHGLCLGGGLSQCVVVNSNVLGNYSSVREWRLVDSDP